MVVFSINLILAIIAIIAGVLVITFPKIIKYAIGGYLIIIGILQLINELVLLV